MEKPAEAEAHELVGNGAPTRARPAAGGAGATPASAGGHAAAALLARAGRAFAAALSSPFALSVCPAAVIALSMYLSAAVLGGRGVLAAERLGDRLSDGVVAAAHVHAQTLVASRRCSSALGMLLTSALRKLVIPVTAALAPLPGSSTACL